MDFWELLVVLLVALLVLGPERLSQLAVRGGRLARRARLMYAQVRAELEREMDASEQASRGGRSGADGERQGDADEGTPVREPHA